ncbi:leucine zipper putative tumor suppressor 2 homolog isoform X1 [Diorhabda sublineata]|uniref:leucine zipper putative tumor suppressor 2 homolog isoform X1 n=2 Tax=Diorhabda sublineata TaxID=1163346 RepID=UPI0024E12263|nr:leucine zipper putative tumor suppressor 2 homolog isoform X1 [Diorhabda sublineata]XP_056631928.1 leucine zipper putative tumor suppressor 2 homolog isoform X1 [Diorhabda sublineata]XP_056631929.1 leucine zipper putative tumor suppressor 2 homolog isoform X1 [Diorhabda sublineata]
MGTIDSGTDTLFSDESPCDLIRSPSICSGDDIEVQMEDTQSINSRLAPPNIQPYSGVLEKGKVVIRPIAFKPSTMTMTGSSRFGMTGERYGSTPILTRPGSRLTLYGSSNDLRPSNNVNNYSLDRKLRSSCPSSTCSPPLAMSSLSSLPHSHKLVNYDSLESVRKSPMSNADSSGPNKLSYRLISASNHSSMMDLTPSPSDSGISELEAALRDRDSELAYLRQTMEHNEQVIFRVYQEKEKVWERELKRLKSVQDSRLRVSSQKVLKLEQMLMMQTYQMQQEKKRFCSDIQRSNMQCDRLRQEVTTLKGRLEETEWGLCQKTGEISLLKSQLKELQMDQTSKCQELIQFRTEQRDLRNKLEQKDDEIQTLKSQASSKEEEIKQLKELITKIKLIPSHDSETTNENREDTEKLKAEIRELREELSELSLKDYSHVEPGRNKGNYITEDGIEEVEIQNINGYHQEDNDSELEKLREELAAKNKQFENERRTWIQEKEKVLRYQRQLQMNYVQMFRRTRALEAEIESLTVELELDKTGLKSKLELSQTIDL